MSSARTNVLLSEYQTAAFLGVAPATLARWRCKGGGPAFLKLGPRRILYDMRDLEKFIFECRRNGTGGSEPRKEPL